MIKQAVLLLVLILGLSGCSTAKLDALREAELPADPYRAALAAQYRALSIAEAEQYDWMSSWIYADKGLRVTYGQETAPENPDGWDLPADKKPAIVAAFETLKQISTPAMRAAHPQAAANAQAFFDCWVEQQAEAWQEQDIAACRKGFEEALAVLRAPAAEGAQASANADIRLSTSYLVFFGWNAPTLGKEAQEVVASAARYLHALGGAYEVVVNGHTDRSGDEAYNLTLSNKRAEMVRNALMQSGIDDKAISVYGFGESDARVPTADGVSEIANRRVEIFVE